MFSHAITSAILDAAELSVAPGKPVFMLNLWRFRAEALYPAPTDLPPCTGREAMYERYIPAFRRLLPPGGATRLFVGPWLASIVGPEAERWDVAAINEYRDFATFRGVVESEAYRREAQPHRIAALADFRLFALDKAM